MSKSKVYNYSGSLHAECEPQTPLRVAALVAALKSHGPDRETDPLLTLRGTGNAIHNQSIGTGRVAILERLPHKVVVDPDEVVQGSGLSAVRWPTVEASGWTTWESVVRATLRLTEPPAGWSQHWDMSGEASASVDAVDEHTASWVAPKAAAAPRRPHLLPYIVPSSGRITVGGSISGDTMTRLSTAFGKESRSLLWVDLLTYRKRVGGAPRALHVLRLVNPAVRKAGVPAFTTSRVLLGSGLDSVALVDDDEDNARFFNAVVGGQGLLGPIVRAKYLLLTLPAESEALDNTFVTRRPADEAIDEPSDLSPDRPRLRPTKTQMPKVWPAYPHSSKAHIKSGVGAEVPARALTWMYKVQSAEALFSTLLQHHRELENGHSGSIRLPQCVETKTVASFALHFPLVSRNDDGFRCVIGNVAFGQTRESSKKLNGWRRKRVRTGLKSVLWGKPPKAELFDLVSWEFFGFEDVVEACRPVDPKKQRPRANFIPEFSFFMEGHTLAVHTEHPPLAKSLQQTWVIPVASLESDEAAEALAWLLKELTDACDLSFRKGGIRINVCDVKVVPATDALLSSAPKAEADAGVAVTVGIEGASWYGRRSWRADPRDVLRRISAEMWNRFGARVHLTKNLFVEPALLTEMYGKAVEHFRAVKGELDPDGLYTSSFWEALAPAP